MAYNVDYVYKLDGATKLLLDTASSPKTAVYYWIENEISYTNFQHLTFINSLNLYSINIDSVLNTLANLSENQLVEEENTNIENIIGQTIDIGQLTNVNIKEAVEGDYLVYKQGKVVNETPPHHDFDRSSEVWSTFTDNNWDEIPGMCVETSNIDVDDYKLSISLNCSSSVNNRYIYLTVFVNDQEQEHLTDEYYFKDKNETMTISFIDRIYQVNPNSKITVRVKRGSGNGTTFKTTRRSFFADEIINT